MSDTHIVQYDEKPAECLAWDPRAPDVASQVGWLIERWLPDVQVEHVGSTSIPGCAGKGVLDLQVVYPPGRLDAVKHVLARLGFQPQQTRDPFPEDRPIRVGAIDRGDKRYRIHAHVIVADSPDLAGDRIFRDRLRADSALRDAYIAHKQAIIDSGVTNSVDYAIAKGAFIEEVLRVGEAMQE